MGTRHSINRNGGPRRDRTADLLHAMQALSQLSYGPPRKDAQRTQPAEPSQVFTDYGFTVWIALSRARLRTCPSSTSVWSIGGEMVPPVTATRSGCATLPSPRP